MPDQPRAVVAIDLPTSTGTRTVIITVPTRIDLLEPGKPAPDGVRDRILAEMGGALAKLGVPLDEGAIVMVERLDEHIAWCSVKFTA